jgi:hypothetical protein
MYALMLLHLRGVGEPSVAALKLTGKPLLCPQVNPEMGDKIASRAKPALTLVTPKPLLAVMRSQMGLQMASRGEHLSAQITA